MERPTEEKDEKRAYTAEDCEETGYGMCLTGKVIVVCPDAFPGGCGNQLYFCTGGRGAGADPVGQAVSGVSLDNGEPARFRRSQILGTLKPQLLPEQAKLQLSQIRPIGAVPLQGHKPLYSGYSFLEDGRYAAGVWLCSEKEARDYVEMQKPYQHKVMLCDMDDFCVMEVVAGKMVFPDEETLRKAQGQADPGCMDLTQ